MRPPDFESQRGKDRRDRREEREVFREPPPHLNELTHTVIGAAIEVHRGLGPGFLESIYEEAMAFEIVRRGIPFQRQVTLPVLYREHQVGESRLDFLVQEEIVLELKAVDSIKPIHRAQTMSYLRTGEFQLGLIINFNVAVLRDGVTRIVWTG